MSSEIDFETLLFRLRQSPQGYSETLNLQIGRFDTCCELVFIHHSMDSMEKIECPEYFPKLISFLLSASLVVPSVAEKMSKNVQKLISLPSTLIRLPNEAAESIIKSAIFLQKRKNLESNTTIKNLFLLFCLPQKQLRNLIYFHIIRSLSDKPTQNKKKKSKKSNRNKLEFANKKFEEKNIKNTKESPKEIFSFLVSKTKTRENNVVHQKKAIGILSEVYKRGTWRDSTTVHAIAECCFAANGSVVRKAIWFLLGEDGGKEDEDLDFKEKSSLAEDRETMKKLALRMRVSKKHSKSKRKLLRVAKKVKRVEKQNSKNSIGEVEEDLNLNETKNPTLTDFSKIRSLFDPQSFAERLFKFLKGTRENFETKLLLMRLISRVASCHELVLPNYFSFLQRYMQPHQRNVTKVLVYLIQACHKKVPSSVLAPCVRHLAFNFVNDRSSVQAACVGINTIREIAARQPLAVEEDILKDVAQCKTSNNKGVSMASKGLISLFREVNPKLLNKNDRGNPRRGKGKKEIGIGNGNGASEDNESEGNESSLNSDEIEITPEFPVDERMIIGDIKSNKSKSDKKGGTNEEKEKFKGNHKKGGGTTNEDKRRRKNFVLTKHRGDVKGRTGRTAKTKKKIASEHKRKMSMKSRRKFKRKIR